MIVRRRAAASACATGMINPPREGVVFIRRARRPDRKNHLTHEPGPVSRQPAASVQNLMHRAPSPVFVRCVPLPPPFRVPTRASLVFVWLFVQCEVVHHAPSWWWWCTCTGADWCAPASRFCTTNNDLALFKSVKPSAFVAVSLSLSVSGCGSITYGGGTERVDRRRTPRSAI